MNFDGLVGPTHHYSGLSKGNRASEEHEGDVSNPQAAALEGLEKMEFLVARGYPQGFFPPHPKTLPPGADPHIYLSASSMWAANSFVATSSSDSADQAVHITVANLATFPHRALEAPYTEQSARAIFPFANVHSPSLHPDEGAANIVRFSSGKILFVHGKSTKKTPARQSIEAQQEIASRHNLNPEKCFFAEQLPAAIDTGVFHNDVISVGGENFFLLHEKSFCGQKRLLETLEVETRIIKEEELTLAEAVQTYFFNIQILGTVALAPLQCKNHPRAKALLEEIFEEVAYFDLTQSMQGGGGPACLRVHLPLTKEEIAQVNPRYVLNLEKVAALKTWVKKHYRDRLSPKDLLDPQLLQETEKALEELP